MDQSVLRYLITAIVIVLMAWMIARNVRLRRQGVKVNAMFQSGNFMQLFLVAGAGVLDLYLLLRAPFPVFDAYVRAFPSPAPIAALIVTIIGALLIAAAQAGMGRSWRVGVPAGEGDVDALITGGLNRISRNPVYLGVMVFLTGIAIAAPGPLTTFALILSFTGLTVIIRKEEIYLREQFGQEYEDYARRVRRWI